MTKAQHQALAFLRANPGWHTANDLGQRESTLQSLVSKGYAVTRQLSQMSSIQYCAIAQPEQGE